MSKDKVEVLLKDVKESKLLEIQRIMGDEWNDSMLERTVFAIQSPENQLNELIEDLIESLTDENPDRPIKTRGFSSLDPEAQMAIRVELEKRGHDCSKCRDATCKLHPINTIQDDGPAH